MFSCVVTVGALLFCCSSHKRSHERIVTQNQSAFQSYNAILASLPSRIDTLNARKQAIMLDIIEDSILNNLPKLPNKQKQALASYVESAVMAASMELPYSSLMDELEASVNSVQISNIQAETKALLELEFNKIQNEYETLALWAGILTVVFLIFTFYSMFKTDELILQGKNGLAELNNIKEKGETSVKSFVNESGKIIQKFRLDFLSFISESRDIASQRLDGLEVSIKNIAKSFDEDTQAKIDVVRKYVEKTKQAIDEEYMRLTDSGKNLEERITRRVDDTDKSLKMMTEKIERMKQQIDVMQAMFETMKPNK